MVKGEKGCDSRHIDEEVLYQAFVDVFSTMGETRDFFMKKWQERLGNDKALVRYKAKQFIGIIVDVESISEFDIDLYCAFVEKLTVGDRGIILVSLLDGTNVESEKE